MIKELVDLLEKPKEIESIEEAFVSGGEQRWLFWSFLK